MRSTSATLVFVTGLGAAALAAGTFAASPPTYGDPAETEVALRTALAQQRLAQRRSERLEAEAARASLAADRAQREAAALAARVQEAEAGIEAADARMALADRARAALREELGHEQGPLVKLTAAIQQLSRRPVVLSVLQPGSVRDLVYTRAMLASAVPAVEQRTAGLRAKLARSRALRLEATHAAEALRAEQASLAARRRELAAIESRQRLASRDAGGSAVREAERALALAEEARDLDALIGELGRAGELRRRLAGLPGPVLRPSQPELANSEPVPFVQDTPDAAGAGAPSTPFVLPVAGRTVTGFGAPSAAGRATGLTFATRPGAQVVAPAAGRVAFAGAYRGYGRIVIIEHPGGWTSLLTGLARADVAVGESLVGGAPLGIAGQRQPVVTFELRRGDEPVNPLLFIG